VADRILQAVGVKRELIEGVETADEINRLVTKYASAQLYHQPGPVIERIRRELVGAIAKDYFPLAREVARKATEPILGALGGEEMVRRGSVLRGPALRGFQRFHRLNVRALGQHLRAAAHGLSDEIESAFLEAQRDGLARKRLIRNLVESDRDELKRLGVVRREIADNAEKVAKADRALGRASKRKQVRARRKLREAKKGLTKAKAKLRTSKSFLARFETRVQGDIRDGIRREVQEANFAHFRQAGYATFSWVAVNGTDACPYCSRQHGKTGGVRDWQGRGPGESVEQGAYCGSACMCELVPRAYTANNESLLNPIKRDG